MSYYIVSVLYNSCYLGTNKINTFSNLTSRPKVGMCKSIQGNTHRFKLYFLFLLKFSPSDWSKLFPMPGEGEECLH